MSRCAVVLLAAVGVLGGCGQQVAGAPSPPGAVDPATSALAAVDPCTLLTDAEIGALGFRPDLWEPNDTLGLVGCSYFGPPLGTLGSLSVNKEPEDTIADYAVRGETFAGFRRNEVNGRPGAQLQSSDDNTDCTQLVDAGSGTVQVTWGIREPGDPCAEALRVMQMIEPELPPVGS